VDWIHLAGESGGDLFSKWEISNLFRMNMLRTVAAVFISSYPSPSPLLQ
jgi:hypothetical protein